MRALLTPVRTCDGGKGDDRGGFPCRYGLATQTLATDVLDADAGLRSGYTGIGKLLARGMRP